MEMLVLDEKDAGHWVYRGEGGANIVLSYTGSSPLFVGKVLRLQKALKGEGNCLNGSSCLSEHEKLLWRCYEEIVSAPTEGVAGRLFVQHVMSPLLGPKHVDAGIQVHASKKFLQEIAKNIESSRPSWRIDASEVDTLSESVLVISDHSLFPQSKYFNLGLVDGIHFVPTIVTPKNISVYQLKLSLNVDSFHHRDISPDENAIKRRVTRFRMHRVLKFHHHEIEDLSDYDPLDLFSGSQERICRALKALFNNPQNNLRENESSEQLLNLHYISLNESLEIVRNFLTAATAKDCSLMFCLIQKKDAETCISHGTVSLQSFNQDFSYKAFFIDLDMKPLEKMEYYYELDQRIVCRYVEEMHIASAAENGSILQMFCNRKHERIAIFLGFLIKFRSSHFVYPVKIKLELFYSSHKLLLIPTARLELYYGYRSFTKAIYKTMETMVSISL
ncbi:hypothetical protein MLD38_024779 [Melastoma candidum]|uniref:Uncharacterized protein n=1 Tax=Melastoma candidum TaxID=119954 RepID=A0ACB9NWT8_9MYRT|nr:hypothetical protein MLD38_024779 [Melastoma candidum]